MIMRKKYTTCALKSALCMMGLACALSGTLQPILARPAASCGQLQSSWKEETAAQDSDIILDKGQSGSLKGRTFKIYQVFDVSISADEQNFSYSWNDQNKSAIQKVVSQWLASHEPKETIAPDQVTQDKAITLIQSLKSVEGNALEPDTGSFRQFCSQLRDQFVQDGVSPIKTESIAADYEGDTYRIKLPGKGYFLVDEELASAGEKKFGGSLCLVSTISGPKTLTLKGVFPEVTKQIEEDDNKVGWNDIGDYESGQTIPYRYNITVPNIAAYQTYTMNFHDKMDAALHLKAETVEITIEGIAANGQEKTVTLTKTGGSPDFTVDTNASAERTFSVNIADIKAIIDQNFYPQGTENSKKVYGQQVTVRYDATLDAAAAGKPGRPGFENQVRLEYSNDPDSNGTGKTGFTPWDTVVAFTFHFSGLKVAEPAGDGQKTTPLAGAHFELYQDEACQTKINLLKQVKEGKTCYLIKNELTVKDGLEEISEIVTDASGAIEIYGLDQGTYYLKETQAPDGYHGPLTPIKLTITPEYTTDRHSYQQGQSSTEAILRKLTGTIEYEESYNGQMNTVNSALTGDTSQGTLSGQIINRTGKELPLTGSNTAWISLAAGTVMTAAGLVTLRFKKSKSVDEAK